MNPFSIVGTLSLLATGSLAVHLRDNICDVTTLDYENPDDYCGDHLSPGDACIANVKCHYFSIFFSFHAIYSNQLPFFFFFFS